MANERFTVVGTNIAEKAAMIWNVADMLRGPFKPHEYGLVILPMTVVKRFHDCLLPTHDKVLKEYESLKAMLTEKYGMPSESREKFTGYTGNYDNSLVMYALKDGEYEWYTTFSTELGDIRLSITSGIKHSTAAVSLVYSDKINNDKVRSSAMDDL